MKTKALGRYIVAILMSAMKKQPFAASYSNRWGRLPRTGTGAPTCYAVRRSGFWRGRMIGRQWMQ